ncbi:MAG TPA: nucleotide exchange factor GrpE [Saprospiraceae bacterium]|jgi:molecular chaperone GrpE|nr:nucleotide exchange factor GrpE [Saprospiraceae bacterium]HQU95124.1 nucleotide exchange factor GrpE [Saprospiraceae bacterium]
MQNNDKENMDQIDNNDELIDDGVVDSTGTADEVTQLTTRIAELEDKNLRLFAEFENFRKRTQKEKYELIKTASQDILSALLPVLDDFDRTKKIADEMAEQDGFVEGVLLVYKKLQTLVNSKGLLALESNNDVFDPELHDAISHIQAPDPSMVGKVIDTIEKGYLLNDKLIRHAKVVVGA